MRRNFFPKSGWTPRVEPHFKISKMFVRVVQLFPVFCVPHLSPKFCSERYSFPSLLSSRRVPFNYINLLKFLVSVLSLVFFLNKRIISQNKNISVSCVNFKFLNYSNSREQQSSTQQQSRKELESTLSRSTYFDKVHSSFTTF